MLAEWHLHKLEYQHFYSSHDKSQMMIAKNCKLDGVMLHFKRRCEGLSLVIAENRLAILEAGIPVMAFDAMGLQRGDMITVELQI